MAEKYLFLDYIKNPIMLDYDLQVLDIPREIQDNTETN